jgi:hypothetical protein
MNMNEISKDSFSVILQNLKCKDIDNLKILNKQIYQDCKDLSMIYKNNKIQEIWGKEIFKIIYDSTNLHKQEIYESFLNNNKLETIKNVLEMFYHDFIFNDSQLTSRKFIEIYSLYFTQAVKNNNNKEILYEHRKECLLKMFKKDEIVAENEKIKLLFGVSSYINRYHGFLGRRVTYEEFILEMQEA